MHINMLYYVCNKFIKTKKHIHTNPLSQYTPRQTTPRTNINYHIRAPELRLIGAEGENIGIVSNSVAQKMAQDAGLDLIEISPNANPPVAKIMDYGRFQYDENKKQKISKATAKVVEVKNIQVKIGTGEADLALKAKKASEWLADGQQVRIELFLSGRSKFLKDDFLNERLQRYLNLISVDFKITVPLKRGPKGPALVIEKKK
jgi:translation initiation factor IF-3